MGTSKCLIVLTALLKNNLSAKIYVLGNIFHVCVYAFGEGLLVEM